MTRALESKLTAAWILELQILSHGAKQPDEASRITPNTDWLIKVMMSGIDSSGYINAELVPPCDGEASFWTLVHRYHSLEQAKQWQDSQVLANLIEELDPQIESKVVSVVQRVVSQFAPTANVATAIVTHVKPGKETEYRQWVSKMHVAQANSNGYRGTFLQPPAQDSRAPWTTLLRFDSAESLDSWIESDTRSKLLSEAEHLLRYDLHRLTSSFPGWFPADPSTGRSPPRYKTAMLVLLILYPLIMTMNRGLEPIRHTIGPAFGTFISNSISVIIISIVMMPVATRLFHFWLFPTGHNPRMESIRGYSLLIFLYAVEIGSFIFLNGAK